MAQGNKEWLSSSLCWAGTFEAPSLAQRTIRHGFAFYLKVIVETIFDFDSSKNRTKTKWQLIMSQHIWITDKVGVLNDFGSFSLLPKGNCRKNLPTGICLWFWFGLKMMVNRWFHRLGIRKLIDLRSNNWSTIIWRYERFGTVYLSSKG